MPFHLTPFRRNANEPLPSGPRVRSAPRSSGLRLQFPRFIRNSDRSSEHHSSESLDPDTVRPDNLCKSCREVFAKSRLIHGSLVGFTPRIETHQLHKTLADFEFSAQDRCHFCVLAWQTLFKKDGVYEKLCTSINPGEDSSITMVITPLYRQSNFRLEIACEGIAKDDGEYNGQPDWSDFLTFFSSKSESFEKNLYVSGRGRIGFKNVPHSALGNVETSSANHAKLIRFWLAECLEKHPLCNRERSGFLPTRLIQLVPGDTSYVRLITTRGTLQNIRYCTLSHCWGGIADILTLKAENHEALHSAIPISSLAKTFQDAITVTRTTGISHIWIDSLCIIQDSIEDWTRESLTMGSIYENCHESLLESSISHDTT